MDKHGFLNGPGLAVYLLISNVELVGVHGVSCGGDVEMYGGGGFEMFLNPFPQGPARLPNVETGAVDVGALVLIDDACLDGFWILVFGVTLSCPDGVGPFEMNLYSSSFAQFLEFVCCFGNVGNYYGGFVVVVVCGVVVGGGGLCLVGVVELMLPLVEGPGRELAVEEGCFDVL